MPSYETSLDAERDLQDIISYTIDRHGVEQMRTYISQLDACAEKLALKDGHFREISAASCTVRVKHCQHHFIFGIDRSNRNFLVIAVLHERMDLMQRLSKRLS